MGVSKGFVDGVAVGDNNNLSIALEILKDTSIQIGAPYIGIYKKSVLLGH